MKKTDALTDAALREALGALAERYQISVYDTIESTSSEAKARARSGERFALIAAGTQTAGRGRLGRSFYSPNGTGVYFSVLHTIETALTNAVPITSAAAVATMRAIRRVCGVQTEIKWVNDLYLNGKKVCGILTEAVFDPSRLSDCSVILGIGINLRGGEFPGELASIAGTLESDADRSTLIAAVIEELLPFFDDPTDRSWLEDYRAYSCVIGHEIIWTRGGKEHHGRAEDIDDNGMLIAVRDNGERELLSSVEVSLRVKA